MAVVWILMTVVGGLLFYGLRCRYQFVYGLIELGAALTIIFLTFVPQTNFLLLRLRRKEIRLAAVCEISVNQ